MIIMSPIRNAVFSAVRSVFDMSRGGSFSPLSLFSGGEQGGWYDPSDLSTLWQDSARTTPVTADGDPVGCIDDKSGNGNHLKQATAGSRPQYKTSGGLHWLEFDGVDDSLSTASIDFTATDTMSLFLGLTKVIDAVKIVVELSTLISANNGSLYSTCGTDAGGIGYVNTSRGTTSATASQAAKAFTYSGSDKAVLAVTHNISGDLSTIRRNTVAGTDGTTDKGAGNFGNYPLYVGARAGTSLFFNGNIYSLIIVNKIASAGEITNTETWVNTKTGAY